MPKIKAELTSEEYWLLERLRALPEWGNLHVFKQKGKVIRVNLETNEFPIHLATTSGTTCKGLPHVVE